MSRYEGTLAALRASVRTALAAVTGLGDSVSYEPPDTSGLSPDTAAQRVYVGVTAVTARQSGRVEVPATMVLGTVTLTVRGYVRRQPTDRTRTVASGTAHSYDEALARAELLLLQLYAAAPISTSTLNVIQEEALWRCEITAQIEWAPTPATPPS